VSVVLDVARGIYKRAVDTGLAARRGAAAVQEGADQAGPEVEVSPFAPGTVSAGAVVAKSLASYIAGRRAHANYQSALAEKKRGMMKDALEVQALEQRIAAGTRTPYKTKSGEELQLTEAEKAAMVRDATGPDAAVKARPRTPISPEEAKRLGVSSYDATKGDVDTDEYSKALTARGQESTEVYRKKVLEGQAESRENTKKKGENAAKYQKAVASLRVLDAQAEDEANQNALAAREQADQALAVIKAGYKANPAAFTRAVSALGLPMDDKGNMLPGADANSLKNAVESLVARAKERGKQRAIKAQRAARLAAQGVIDSEAGLEQPVEAAFVPDWANDPDIN